MLLNDLRRAHHLRLHLLAILDLTLQVLILYHRFDHRLPLDGIILHRIHVLALAPVLVSPDTNVDRGVDTETLTRQLEHNFLVQFPRGGEVFPLDIGQDDVRAEVVGGQGGAQLAVAGFDRGGRGLLEEVEGKCGVVDGEA